LQQAEAWKRAGCFLFCETEHIQSIQMKKSYTLCAVACLFSAISSMAQTKNAGPQVLDPEPLDRGVVVIPASGGGMLINWRSLVTDRDSVTFTIYKNGSEKIYASTDSKAISYLDAAGTTSDTYKLYVRKAGKIVEKPSSHYFPAGYLEIPIDRPSGGTTTTGAYTYTPGDGSVGDVDGDGEYEIILKWDPTNLTDNGQPDKSLQFVTGNVLIDCYKLDGTKLWRVDLGRNIRAGAHYTQFLVYDFDGDGRAELACKTAPGTIDGRGNYVLMGNDDPNADYRKTYNGCQGIIKTGPEYLTVFSGLTGENLATVAYEPGRDVQADGKGSGKWGDTYGNRSERYLACVAYLDGKHPSIVMCRGYYTASYLCAWDFDGQTLTKRWLHASETSGQGAYGEGAHSLAVGDVDGDGCDEITYGSACIDHDGRLLYRTGFGHGDALHLGDFDPDREGLEVFMVHEEKGSSYLWDTEFRDARTGKVIWGLAQSGNDIGRGLCADIDSTKRGAECWPIGDYSSGSKTNAVFTCKGENFSGSRPSVNFATYFKNYRYQQVLEEGKLDEWNTRSKSAKNLINFVSKYGVGCGLIKNVPVLQADILGDWREEIIYYDNATKSKLRVFTSPYPTEDVIPTFMHDHLYRMSIAWQNVAYNQPPHLSYYLPDFDYDLYLEKMKGSADGIHDVWNDRAVCDFALFASPDLLRIRCSGLEGETVRLSVVDMSGRTLWDDSPVVGEDGFVAVDNDRLGGKHGVYLISVTTRHGKWVKKAVR